MSAAYVYRCFDEEGRLLYVGSTSNLFQRLKSHRNTSWWALQVAKVQARVYPTRERAREAERIAIRTEHPRWNVMGKLVLTPEHAADLLVSIERGPYNYSAQSQKRMRRLRTVLEQVPA